MIRGCLIILCAVFSEFQSTLSSNLSDVEISALQSLYDATNGPLWLPPPPGSVAWNFTTEVVDPCLNWTGVTCNSCATESYCTIVSLALPLQGLKGTLPTAIGDISNVTLLDLSYNAIAGLIPSEIGKLKALTELNVLDDYLSGPIPLEVGYLSSLVLLELGSNLFNSTLPPSIFSLTNLEVFNLHQNSITGTVPTSMEKLKSLSFLWFSNNPLHGTIPTNLGSMTALKSLHLAFNSLEGTIPPSLGYLTQLTYLTLEGNSLNGTVPSSISNLTSNLKMLKLKSNQLTGLALETLFYSDPSVVTSTNSLITIDITFNSLSGSIPDSIANMHSLELLFAGYNQFTGTIPTAVQALSVVSEFIMQYNFISGTIPSILCDGQTLRYFDVYWNRISGSIPALIGYYQNLTSIDIGGNFMTGSLPPSIGNLRQLAVFAVNFNQFSGLLPSNFVEMTGLVTLLLDNNYFSGREFSDSATFPLLSVVDISDNLFYGRVPGITGLPQITVMAASRNCFTGTIPTAICAATTLKTISFDGLSSGGKCIRPILFPVSSGIYTSTPLEGVIPGCLFTNLSNLEVLQLSGNGLSGFLPDIPEDSKLVNISLNHNRIRGSIPESYKSRYQFTQLDLSFNKIKGTANGMNNYTLVSSSSDDSTTVLDMYMNVNRLSGYVPNSFHDASVINILSGNYFTCRNPSAELPENDPDYKLYSCGSTVLDASLFMFFVLTICVSFIYGFYSLHKMISCRNEALRQKACHMGADEQGPPAVSLYDSARGLFWTFYSELYSLQFSHIQYDSLMLTLANKDRNERILLSVVETRTMLLMFTEIRHFVGRTSLIILGLLMPCYIVFAIFYSTHTYQYGWFVSVAFTTSYVEGICLLFIWSIFLWYCFDSLKEIHKSLFNFHSNNIFRRQFKLLSLTSTKEYLEEFDSSNRSRKTDLPHVHEDSKTPTRTWNEFVYLYCVIPLFNGVIVLTINGVFVYIVLAHSAGAILLAQVALVLFKNLWNVKVVPAMIRNVKHVNNNWWWMWGCFGCNSHHKSGEDSDQEEEDHEGDLLLARPESFRSSYRSDMVRFSTIDPTNVADHSSISRGTFTTANSMVLQDANAASQSEEISVVTEDAEATALGLNVKNQHYRMQILLIMFNNIMAPILATAAADSNCFLGIFQAPESVNTYYNYPTCVGFSNHGCVAYADDTEVFRSYTPPYVYYFQCSSSVLTSYVPVYIYTYIYIGLVLPLIYQLIVISSRFKSKMKAKSSSATELGMEFEHIHVYANLLGSKKYGLFRAPNTCCTIVAHVAVLLTFGVAYPPLALIIFVYMCTTTWTWQSLLSRLFALPELIKARGNANLRKNSTDEEDREQEEALVSTVATIFANMEEQCVGMWQVFHDAKYLILTGAGFFYAFFLFDIVGDNAIELGVVIWVPICMLIIGYIVGKDKVKWFHRAKTHVATVVDKADSVSKRFSMRASSADTPAVVNVETPNPIQGVIPMRKLSSRQLKSIDSGL